MKTLNSELNEVNAMYKYSLHNKSIKHICPLCLKKRLVLYIDNETQTYLSEKVGRCDREISCGYHYTPKIYFQDNNVEYIPKSNKLALGKKILPKVSYLPNNLVDEFKFFEEENNFIVFLKTNFNSHQINDVIDLYKIGTATIWRNSTIFWQIDINNNVHSGKMILYKRSGKRTKYINWVHSYLLKTGLISEFNLKQCLFGEHLLNNSKKDIAIVESEKTACIMSIFFDKYIWMATGSLTGLTLAKIEVLKTRKIILYPDLGIEHGNYSPYTLWKSRCEEFQKLGFDINISDLLERNCTEEERKLGLDLADYFLQNLSKKPYIEETKEDEMVYRLCDKNIHIRTLIKTFDITKKNGEQYYFD